MFIKKLFIPLAGLTRAASLPVESSQWRWSDWCYYNPSPDVLTRSFTQTFVFRFSLSTQIRFSLVRESWLTVTLDSRVPQEVWKIDGSKVEAGALKPEDYPETSWQNGSQAEAAGPRRSCRGTRDVFYTRNVWRDDAGYWPPPKDPDHTISTEHHQDLLTHNHLLFQVSILI